MMQFDFLTSNPAFNIAESNNKAGTGGNTTLYRTATRRDFDKLLKQNGVLLNITLKGIIPDLIHKHFKNWQVHSINLMDDIDVWEYNTCYFFVEKTERFSKPMINGGLCSKIFSPYENDCFPFVYYSGADKGMSGFDPTFPNRVIRKLPGASNDSFIYDFTDVDVSSGPKFAFNVMESKKSYSVTDEPIRGGTICYIPTKTLEQAEKLKLFVENNEIYKKYIDRIKQKYHAFGLRNVRSFDLDQIQTGYEIPTEWNITDEDINNITDLHNEVVENRTNVKEKGEVFTPTLLVKRAFNKLSHLRNDAFSNPSYTFCDTMAGDGKFLLEVLNQKMANGIDKRTALSTIYGVELDPDNVKKCQSNLIGDDKDLKDIVERNIVCHDTLTYNFEFGQGVFDNLFDTV